MSDVDPTAALIAEQVKHTVDLLKAEIEKQRAELQHYKDLANHRLAELEKAEVDHENRIRDLRDSSTTFKTWSGLASGGSSILAITAFVKSILLP